MSKKHNFSTVFFPQLVSPIILQTERGWERGLDGNISLIKTDHFNGTKSYGDGFFTSELAMKLIFKVVY